MLEVTVMSPSKSLLVARIQYNDFAARQQQPAAVEIEFDPQTLVVSLLTIRIVERFE